MLGNNATVVSDDVPTEISVMLDQAEKLLINVGDSNLREVMDEASRPSTAPVRICSGSSTR